MLRRALMLLIVGCGSRPAAVPESLDARPPVPSSLASVRSEAPAASVEAPPSETRPESPPPADIPPPPDPMVVARERAEAARRAFEEAFPRHGITFHFLARVRARPHHEAKVAGYMRRGARFRASERVPGVGCARGWYRVPGGGFVCRGEGFLIGEEPPSFEPVPVPPALEDALPYAYAYVPRDDVPQYWRVPSVDEELEVRASIEAQEAMEGTPEMGSAASEERGPAEDELSNVTESPPDAASSYDSEPAAAVAVEAPPPPGESESAEDAPPASVAMPDIVRLRMRRGFYVSIDGEERDDGRRFVRTVRGAYVRSDRLIESEPPTHRGLVLGGSWQLPIGVVWRSGTHRLKRRAHDGRFRDVGVFDQHTPLRVLDELERAGRRYVVGGEGDIARRTSVRLATSVLRPEGVGVDERWLHVRLSEQTLVAYEGDTPVFATTVSTGRASFETPTGLFRIQSKHVSTTMDDLQSDEPYLIEDVPWTMYFEGNFALHAAFWHHHFGRVRSHGCVNLAPVDARWLFQWTDPPLPASWHGVFADRDRMGTAIFISED